MVWSSAVAAVAVAVACSNVSFSVILFDMLAELEELDESRAWPRLFQVRYIIPAECAYDIFSPRALILA